MGYKTAPKKTRVPKKIPAAKLSREEMRSQLVGWSIYRITHSTDSVKENIKTLFSKDSQKKQRERFPGFLEGEGGTGTDELIRKKKVKELKEFLEEPAGKEFTLFVRNRADGSALDNFMEKCGLLRNVSTDYYAESAEAESAEFPDMVIVTAKKKAVKRLGPGIGKAHLLSKGGLSTKDNLFISGVEEALESNDPKCGSEKPTELEDIPGPARVKKTPKEVSLADMKLKVLNAAKTRKVALFPNAEVRNEFMANYEAGAEYSFEIKGSSSFKTYFKNEMRERGLDPEQVKISKGPGKKWEVTLLEDGGRTDRKRYLDTVKYLQG